MTIIANLLLFLTVIVYIVIVKTIYLKKAPNGDYGVGYSWAFLLYHLTVFILLSAIVGIIGVQGGFQWVANTSLGRILGVGVGLLATTFFLIFCGTSWYGLSPKLRTAAQIVAAILPFVLLLIAFVLVNKIWLGSPIMFGIRGFLKFTSICGLVLLFTISFLPTIKRFVTTIKYFVTPPQLSDNEKRILAEIDSCDLEHNMIFLMVHTVKYRSPIIRKRAVEKIKTKPDWQEELVKKMDTAWAEHVFMFLGSNDVETPKLFIEAINKGILQEAQIIGQKIATANMSNLYEGIYYSRIENIVATVQKFENKGYDYLPAMEQLLKALKIRKEKTAYTQHELKLLDEYLSKKR